MSHAMRVTGAIGTALVVLSLALVACGGGGAGSRTVPGPSAARSHRKSPADRSRPRSKGARKHLAPAPPCRARDLVVWHSRGGGGAMSTFYTAFTVTNLSGHACRVAGTPRLEALDVGNRPIGPAAHPGGMPGESRRRSVRIPAHGDAAFRASWPENAYAAGECRPRTVAGYRVFLPGSQMARFVPYPGPGRCSNPNAERAFSVGRLEEPDEPRGGGRAPAPVLITPRAGEQLPRCPASKLVAWLGVDAFAGVGGGHSYTRLDVINLSGRPCELSGDPRVVAVGNSGRSIGPPARGGPGMVAVGRAGRRVPVARLRPDGTAEFMLSIADPGDYGSGECGWKQAAGLRITFPGSKRTQTLPMPLRRCPHRMVGGPQLSVGPLE